MTTQPIKNRSNKTRQFAVIGNPIEHSRSPELHHAFAKATNIDLNYQKILVPLDGFNASVKDFFANDGQGLNVTVPFKEQAFALCDEITTRASVAGAVNTLWQQDGKLYGDNTDGQGLVDALDFLNCNLKQAKVLILGAGGATRGVILPLVQAGVAHLVIANRTVERAQQLLNDVKPYIGTAHIECIGLDQLTGDFDLIINATSASLSGDALVLPAQLKFRYAYEMAYGKPSSFLQQAQARHVPNNDGFSMLVGQAIEAFSIWNGVKPELGEFL